MSTLRVKGVVAAAGAVALALFTASGAEASGCASTSSPYASAVAGTTGIVSYWRLGESSGTAACDAVGSNTGTYQGGYTLGQTGALNGDPDTALGLNGSNGIVSVPHSSSLDVGDKFTLEAWVKRGSVGGSNNQAVASQQAKAWLLMFNPSNHLVLRDATVADVASSKATVTDNAWHQVAVTKNGSAVHLYIDGVDQTGSVSNQTLQTNTLPLTIGQSSGTSYWNGTIDEVSLYSRDLSASEIQSHYNQATTTPSPTPAPTPAPDPVIGVAGDIACDPSDPNYNGGLGNATNCHQKYTSDLLVNTGLSGVVTLGDEQYEDGAYSKFQTVYNTTWGRAVQLSHPAVGNHEYLTSNASGYFDYFNGPGNQTGAAGDRSQGYYSYDIGTWHLIALNSNCSQIGGCGSGSPQETWLRNDLATHPNKCTLAYWHHPRFTSGPAGNSGNMGQIWTDLYNANADLILSAHDHHYERFAPQTPAQVADPNRGIREFVVGTGGKSLVGWASSLQPNSEVRDSDTYGILRLTLHPSGYDWQFVPEAGKTFTDSGSASCH
ncbi:MAG: metallophosphoesterase [Actinobacteria bacterium]|nr:metallophosphoesterase [Actinomycetota bacterium]